MTGAVHFHLLLAASVDETDAATGSAVRALRAAERWQRRSSMNPIGLDKARRSPPVSLNAVGPLIFFNPRIKSPPCGR